MNGYKLVDSDNMIDVQPLTHKWRVPPIIMVEMNCINGIPYMKPYEKILYKFNNYLLTLSMEYGIWKYNNYKIISIPMLFGSIMMKVAYDIDQILFGNLCIIAIAISTIALLAIKKAADPIIRAPPLRREMSTTYEQYFIKPTQSNPCPDVIMRLCEVYLGYSSMYCPAEAKMVLLELDNNLAREKAKHPEMFIDYSVKCFSFKCDNSKTIPDLINNLCETSDNSVGNKIYVQYNSPEDVRKQFGDDVIEIIDQQPNKEIALPILGYMLQEKGYGFIDPLQHLVVHSDRKLKIEVREHFNKYVAFVLYETPEDTQKRIDYNAELLQKYNMVANKSYNADQ